MSKIKIASHPGFSKINNIKYGFFTRLGGVSTGEYESLNLKEYNCNDSAENVKENINRALEYLNIATAKFLNPQQVHSNKVIIITDLQQVWQNDNRPEADAIVTNIAGVALGIITADCVPVLFADSKNNIIGAAHAGWQGARNGILENTVKAMRELGADIADIQTVVGPCIHQKSYEVSQEFYDNILTEDQSNSTFFIPSPQHDDGHFMFDLPGYAKSKIQKAGIDKVYDVNIDTYSNKDEFFSYRMACHEGNGECGRQGAVIALKR